MSNKEALLSLVTKLSKVALPSPVTVYVPLDDELGIALADAYAKDKDERTIEPEGIVIGMEDPDEAIEQGVSAVMRIICKSGMYVPKNGYVMQAGLTYEIYDMATSPDGVLKIFYLREI